MTGELVNFALLSLSSMLIIINPLAATLVFVSLASDIKTPEKQRIAKDACVYAFLILIAFTLLGGLLLQLFGITLDAFRIGGGILLFGIGMEMVYARTSRTKMTDTEKYESIEGEDISVMPMAIPMIAGPGAITTTIVLTAGSLGIIIQMAIVIASITLAIIITYVMMVRSELIVARIGQKEFRVINRLMGMLLIAIAVQFVITGLRSAFPLLAGA
ncbi:MAG TPA: MarC family protein [Methanoregulaceae archaeon]|nr:MarC family protein [Methanoregulaceae archaeon]